MSRKVCVERYFDGLDAAAYADQYSPKGLTSSSSGYFFQRRQAIVERILQSLDGGTIVDVGCGPGIYAEPCVARGFRYSGIDLSARMIEEARRRFGHLEGVEFTVSDGDQLPLPSDSIDGLLCLGMLEYVSRENEVRYLEEMVRVVRPGGMIIFSFLNARSPYRLWDDFVFPGLRLCLWHVKEVLKKSKLIPFRDFSARAFTTRKFSMTERLALLRSMDLKLVQKIYFSPDVFPPRSLFVRPSTWASATLDRVLPEAAYSWLGRAFVIVVQKSAMASAPSLRRPHD